MKPASGVQKHIRAIASFLGAKRGKTDAEYNRNVTRTMDNKQMGYSKTGLDYGEMVPIDPTKAIKSKG